MNQVPDGSLALLVVEDEPSLRRLVDHHLQAQGFEVSSVRCAEDALDRLDESPPDIMILDLMLPGIDGLELLRRLEPRARAMPVIVMSAHAEMDAALEALRLGAADFLPKPVVMDALDRALERAATRLEPRLAGEDGKGAE